MKEEKDTVTLGVQAGDVASSDATRPHFMLLRKLLAAGCRGPYSPEVKEFALILRIDGDIYCWNKEGCGRMRRSKKDYYITIDIYVPKGRWQGKTPAEIRSYLAEQVEQALSLMIGKLQADKVPIQSQDLLNDWQTVKQKYFEQTSSPPAA